MKMKKKLIITLALAVVLVIAIILAVTSCTANGQEMPKETLDILETAAPTDAVTEPTTEPTEEPTEATEEPTEAEIPTEAPAAVKTESTKGATTAQSSFTPTATEPPATQPAVVVPPAVVSTQPPETEPAVTNPPATEPATSQPPATEPVPVTCQHDWQTVYHEEVGHKEYYCGCACGAKFLTDNEWWSHAKSYSAEEAILYHGGYASGSEWVVDTPAYTEWVCSKCGATSDTQP